MASLENKFIYETYKGLIKTQDNEPIDGAAKALTDGEGNLLPISVSETDVEVGFLTSKNLFIEEYGEVIDQNGNWVGPSQGLSGTSGTSGTSGANGSSGIAGTSGTSGTSGATGSSGQTGSNGTSGTSGLSGLGLPSKVIFTDATGWTDIGSFYSKTFNFGSAFANTNYSTDFVFKADNFEYSNSFLYNVNFSNKTTTSVDVLIDVNPQIVDNFSGRLVLIAAGESNGSGTSGTSGQNGTSGINGSAGTSGTSGQTGTNGTSGTSGTAGTSGTTGVNGTSGTTGTSGTSGVSNDGTSGTSGTSGANGISTGRTYYMNQSQASDVTPYRVLATEPSTAIEQVVTQTGIGAGVTRLMTEFITPQLGFTIIPGGVQRFHTHLKKNQQQNNFEAFVTVELANSAGVSYGQVLTSNAALITWIDVNTPVEVLTDIVFPTTTILETDRIIVKVYAKNIDSGSHTVNFYTEGTSNYSYVVTSVAAASGTSGTSGTSGLAGTSGTSGTSGIGQAGTSGTSGTSGGGSSNPIYINSIKVPATISNIPFYKLNVFANTFGGVNFALGAGSVRYTPVTSLVSGEVINELAVFCSVAVAASSLRLGLYSITYNAAGNFYANTLLTTFGDVDTSTTGRKTITNINYTIPTSDIGWFYIGLLQLGGATSASIFGPQNSSSPAMYGSLDSTIQQRGMSVNGATNQTTIPATISAVDWSGYTSNTVYAFIGFK